MNMNSNLYEELLRAFLGAFMTSQKRSVQVKTYIFSNVAIKVYAKVF